MLGGGLSLSLVSPSHRSLHIVPVLAVLGPPSMWAQLSGRSGCGGTPASEVCPQAPARARARATRGPGSPWELTPPLPPLAR